MANTKLSALPVETNFSNSDFLIKVKSAGGGDVLVTLSNFLTAIGMSAWTSWTPSWTNLTVGNATVTAKYVQMGKFVAARLHIVWGSTTSASGSISFSLPVTAASYPGTATAQPIGKGAYYDVSAGNVYGGPVLWASTSTGQPQVYKSDLTYLYQTTMSSTVPATWTSPDEWHLELFYEAA